ncbi:MAG: hypothetical protein ACI4BB_13695 [Coprococcus sp.]
MNERFTLDSTLMDIVENERVNRKLPIFFDLQLSEQVKWPFNKMKLKYMMQLIHFPAQELVDASNFILERREAGTKISIPVWRDLPEEEADTAKNVVLIPFASDMEEKDVPAVLICPGSENGHLKMATESMRAAERMMQAGCRAFILNIRTDYGAVDMMRAVRFLRANCRKLGILQEKVAVLAFGEVGIAAMEMYLHGGNIEDVTHRYDGIKGEPDQLWLMDIPEENGDGILQGNSGENSGKIYVCREESRDFSGSPWLEERLDALKKGD